MGNIVAKFDPSAAISGTFSSNLSNGIGKIIIWNESNWALDLTFTDGETDLAAAWTASIFELTGPAGKIAWAQDTQLISNFPPLSKVWVVAYRDNERIPGVFPLALVRQATIGNQIALTTAATSIQNDASIAGTSLIESKAGADAQSAVTLDNTGVMTLGNGLGRIGKLFLNDNNSQLSVQGSASFDNSNVIVNGGGTGQLQLLSLVLSGGVLNGIRFGFHSATTGGTVITHGLGTTPSAVFICPRAITTDFNVDVVGAATFTVTVGANCNVWWLAIA